MRALAAKGLEGEYSLDEFLVSEQPTLETIRELTRTSLELLLHAYIAFFETGENGQLRRVSWQVQGDFEKLRESLRPDAKACKKFDEEEKRFEAIECRSGASEMQEIDTMIASLGRMKEYSKPRLPIPYLPTLMARDAERNGFYRMKPPEATVTPSHNAFLCKYQDQIEAELQERTEAPDMPFQYMSTSRDAIAILDRHQKALFLCKLETGSQKRKNDHAQTSYEILEYSDLIQEDAIVPKQTLDSNSSEMLQVFHYPHFFSYLCRILPGFEQISLRAQMQLFDYLIRQDEDGARTVMKAWSARLAAVSPYTPNLNFLGLMDKESEEHLKQFLEAFSICGYDPELQETLLSIAKQPSATVVLHEIFRIIQSAAIIAADVISSYEKLQIQPPTKTNILASLMENSKKLITEYAQNPRQMPKLYAELGLAAQKAKLTQSIIRQALRSGHEVINPQIFDTLAFYEISAHDLIYDSRMSALKEQIIDGIKHGFSEMDADNFIEFANNNGVLHLCMCEEQVVCSFGTSKLGDQFQYLDWFIANPESKIRTLATAFAREKLQELSEESDLALAAKPNGNVIRMAIEESDFVCGELVQEKENDMYLLCRKLHSDHQYLSKEIPNEQLKEKVCNIPYNKPFHYQMSNCPLVFLRIDRKSNDYSALYDLLSNNDNEKLVLTRVIKSGTDMLYVFEPEKLDPEKGQRFLEQVKKVAAIYPEGDLSIAISQTVPRH